MNSLIALGILVIGLLCALTARALILTAAFRISWKWGLGVLLPFGPMVFRLKYPDDARPARPFQLATIPCVFLYLLLGPGTGSSLSPRLSFHKTSSTAATPATGYALEKPAPSNKSNTGLGSFFRSGPTIEQRRVANVREFERLAIKDKELKLRKRDLLRSDVEGNAAFARDQTEYTTALAKANAEKNELAKPSQ